MSGLSKPIAIATLGSFLALGSALPAHADTPNSRTCSTNFGLGVTANWPVEISVRPDHTIAAVTPGNPYLSGLVLPGESFVSGSTWTHWTLTNDRRGITVTGGGQIAIGWVTSGLSCQAFWSF